MLNSISHGERCFSSTCPPQYNRTYFIRMYENRPKRATNTFHPSQSEVVLPVYPLCPLFPVSIN